MEVQTSENCDKDTFFGPVLGGIIPKLDRLPKLGDIFDFFGPNDVFE